MKYEMSDEEIKTLFNRVDKLEKRIFLLEKVIGKLQLRLGDVVLYMDKKEEIKTWTTKNTSGDETIWVGKK